MSDQHALARRLRSAAQSGRRIEASQGATGRALLARLVECWVEERGWQDVASPLRFTADSLDPDTDFEFMRP